MKSKEKNIFKTDLRVQFFDTDKMGIVHHANYIRYFEVARTEQLREAGMPYSAMESDDFQIPVLGVQAKFHTPAFYDEVITVSCEIVKLAPASMEIEYQITNKETGEVHVTGRTRHGFTTKNLKPVALKKYRPEFYEYFKSLVR